MNRVMTPLEFATAEMLDIHDQLDKLAVPNVVDGERLSASQRVAVLVGAYKSACELRAVLREQMGT